MAVVVCGGRGRGCIISPAITHAAPWTRLQRATFSLLGTALVEHTRAIELVTLMSIVAVNGHGAVVCLPGGAISPHNGGLLICAALSGSVIRVPPVTVLKTTARAGAVRMARNRIHDRRERVTLAVAIALTACLL